MEPRTIVFTGFMGAGKTKVGRRIADLLRRGFCDMDQILIKRHGPIGDIFRQHGEKHFRKLERELFGELLAMKWSVISTGGGTLVVDDNRELAEVVRENAIVVWLAVDYDVAAERVKKDAENQDRPNADAAMLKRFAERQEAYNRVAHIVVDANFSLEEVIDDALQALKMAG